MSMKTDLIQKVPFYTKNGQKAIDVAAIQVGGAMVLMAFEETYVNKAVEIGKMSEKLMAQIIKPREEAIAEAGDAARDEVQDQSGATPGPVTEALESQSPTA